MTTENASRMISIQRKSIIQPANPSSHPQSMFLSFSDLLLGRFSGYINRAYFYDLKVHDYAVVLESLKRSLERSLVPFFPLAGRLAKDEDGRPHIDCNDEGVEFVEAIANVPFSELANDGFQYRKMFTELTTRSTSKQSDFQDLPIMSIQVTKFQGDGMAVCVSISHAVVDAYSFYDFVRAWGRLCRGLPLAELEPQHMRTALNLESLLSISKACCAAPERNELEKEQHDDAKLIDIQGEGKNIVEEEGIASKLKQEELGIDFSSGAAAAKQPEEEDMVVKPKQEQPAGNEELVQKLFSFSEETIQKLEKQASEEEGERSFTTYELFCAHWWKALVKAGGYSEEQQVLISLPYNCRGILPSIPTNYFGNCVWVTIGMSTGGEVGKGKISKVAAIIQEAVAAAATPQNITKAWIEGEKNVQIIIGSDSNTPKVPQGGVWAAVDSPKVAAYDTDFGWGRPCAVRVPGPWPASHAYMMDGCKERGAAIELMCSLPLHALQNNPDLLLPC